MKILLTILLSSFFFLANAQLGIQLSDITPEKTSPITLPLPSEKPPALNQVFGPSSTLNSVLKSDYNTHLAFFCKVEVQLEKATKIPIKFRLGDVDTVDRLEGKRRRY